jgi:hypothetical protein
LGQSHHFRRESRKPPIAVPLSRAISKVEGSGVVGPPPGPVSGAVVGGGVGGMMTGGSWGGATPRRRRRSPEAVHEGDLVGTKLASSHTPMTATSAAPVTATARTWIDQEGTILLVEHHRVPHVTGQEAKSTHVGHGSGSRLHSLRARRPWFWGSAAQAVAIGPTAQAMSSCGVVVSGHGSGSGIVLAQKGPRADRVVRLDPDLGRQARNGADAGVQVVAEHLRANALALQRLLPNVGLKGVRRGSKSDISVLIVRWHGIARGFNSEL